MIYRPTLKHIMQNTIPTLTYLGIGTKISMDIPHLGHITLTYTNPSNITIHIVGYPFTYIVNSSYDKFIEHVTCELANKTHSQLTS